MFISITTHISLTYYTVQCASNTYT